MVARLRASFSIPKIEIRRAAEINLPVILRIRTVLKMVGMPERAAMVLPFPGIWTQNVIINKAKTPNQYGIQQDKHQQARDDFEA